MARETVSCKRKVDADAEAVWAFLSDFARPWHPLVEWMEPEEGNPHIRRFAVKDEDTIYREQLTYLSHSERLMRYTCLEGIEGVQSYRAELAVEPVDAGGSLVSWRAEVVAGGERALEIAQGTEVVFEAGLAVLDKLPVEEPSLELLLEKSTASNNV